ncbi:hypothetical protein H9L13_10655 [Sphingomonas lutea]|uniref:Uncharacterized protein n=1 Tax=Sphingomonas lutea TaxID=1045317 RepID=A0A7G9SGV5_9SPHN|nr:hypothetical protein [Sphingomonas lutea]QNN67080.1 hypothetical protein H9L13_10655 [Sphingomonas lutea]
MPRSAPLAIAVAALAACAQDHSDQNIIIDNNVSANADIEELPADESSATPSEELANGAVEADRAAGNNSL